MSTPELYEKTYDELYDDHDKYFDYVFDFHEDMQDFIRDKSFLILDRDKFSDFFDFCAQHINRPLLDAEIKEKHIRILNRQIRETGDDDLVYDQEGNSYGYSVYDECDEEFIDLDEIDEVVDKVVKV